MIGSIMADKKPTNYPPEAMSEEFFTTSLMTEVACRLGGIDYQTMRMALSRLVVDMAIRSMTDKESKTVEEIADMLMPLLPQSTTEPGVN